MNEYIIHMRQDAFLPVKGVGLTPHVPGLKGALKKTTAVWLKCLVKKKSSLLNLRASVRA